VKRQYGGFILDFWQWQTWLVRFESYHIVNSDRPVPKDMGESGNRKEGKLCNGDFVISGRF